jgi:hypothetical protein
VHHSTICIPLEVCNGALREFFCCFSNICQKYPTLNFLWSYNLHSCRDVQGSKIFSLILKGNVYQCGWPHRTNINAAFKLGFHTGCFKN